MGARSPLTLHPSWTGAQLNNLMIPNTSQDNITAPGTSTGTNASTSNNKPTTTDPNSAEQRAIFNLAGAYNNLFGMPQYDLRASAMLGTPRAFLLDNPVMQDLTQIMNAGLRSYMSAPNGDFVAWFPDYYGIYGTDPVLDEANALHGKIEAFLQQDIGERATSQQSLQQLTALFK